MRSVTHSYEYNALCDVCKFKFKASELRQRWDGLMVCKWDWESRHPQDFYRAISDVHLLPFIRSNVSDVNLTWTPVFANLTVTLNNGETELINTGIYILDTMSATATTTVNTTSGTATVDFLSPNLLLPQQDALSVTSSNGTTTTMTLPTTSGGTGTCRVMTREAKFLGSANISASATTVTLPAWTARGGLIISFSYGT